MLSLATVSTSGTTTSIDNASMELSKASSLSRDTVNQTSTFPIFTTADARQFVISRTSTDDTDMELTKIGQTNPDNTRTHSFTFTTADRQRFIIPITSTDDASMSPSKITKLSEGSDDDDASSVTSSVVNDVFSISSKCTSVSTGIGDRGITRRLGIPIPVREVQLAHSLLALDEDIPHGLDDSTRTLMERLAAGEHFKYLSTQSSLDDLSFPSGSRQVFPRRRRNGVSNYQNRHSKNEIEVVDTTITTITNPTIPVSVPESPSTWTEDLDFRCGQTMWCLDEDISEVCSEFTREILAAYEARMLC